MDKNPTQAYNLNASIYPTIRLCLFNSFVNFVILILSNELITPEKLIPWFHIDTAEPIYSKLI